MLKNRKTTWSVQQSKKIFPWFAMLCMLLQLALNLPSSEGQTTSEVNTDFLFDYGGGETITLHSYSPLDLVYKEDKENKKDKEDDKKDKDDDNQNDSEDKVFLGQMQHLPIRTCPDSFVLFTVLSAQNIKIAPLPIVASVAVPKYILYKQFKYHLG